MSVNCLHHVNGKCDAGLPDKGETPSLGVCAACAFRKPRDPSLPPVLEVPPAPQPVRDYPSRPPERIRGYDPARDKDKGRCCS